MQNFIFLIYISTYFPNTLRIFQYVTQNSTFTRQNTLSFIILKLLPKYTLISEVYVCNKVT